jgi:hypothetical protein
MQISHTLIATTIITLVPNIAFAYIDPASGSALMSAIIGIFVATAIFIKTYWYKLKSFFKTIFCRGKQAATQNTPEKTTPDTASTAKQPDTASTAKQPDTASTAKQPDTASTAKQPDTASTAKQPDTASTAKQPDTDNSKPAA